MKTKFLSMMLVVVMVLSLGVSAGAATADGRESEIAPQYAGLTTCSPSIEFSGKTAKCKLLAIAKESSATITLNMILYEVNASGVLTRVATWSNLTGTGRISVSKTYSGAVSGKNYRLSVNGTVKDSSGSHSVGAYADGKCP